MPVTPPIQLPIDTHLPALAATVGASCVLVLAAEPGAGKTTRLPPALLDVTIGQVLCLQPRRVAARAAAQRVADENGWQLGREVGYHVRFDRVSSDQTRLLFLTEALLTRRLIADPLLDGVGCVILDEFHERSIHADLALAMLKEVRAARPDLAVVVMSATLDAGPVAEFIDAGAPVTVGGRVFPVDVVHRPPAALDLSPDGFADAVAHGWDAVPDDGDVLIFLPGAAEIDATLRRQHLPEWDKRPLHGSLPFDEQQAALRPSERRRVICATNIAETSLTVPGVRCVIDTGWARQARFDPQRGMDKLELARISHASATQRAGRAGRTEAGVCVRLWRQSENSARPKFDAPEVHRVDLADGLLAVHGWGTDGAGFGWFDRPKAEMLGHAEGLLELLGATRSGRLTDIGERLREIPVHPRLGRLLIEGGEDAVAVAALLSEKPIGRGMTLGARLRDLQQSRDPAAERVRRTMRQLHRFAGKSQTVPLATLALLAFPDRLCRMRDELRGVMPDGRGVKLAEPLAGAPEFLVALDVRHDTRSRAAEATVTLAEPVALDLLYETFGDRIRVSNAAVFDAERGKVIGVRRTTLGDLVLREDTGVTVDDTVVGEALFEALRPDAAGIVEREAGDLWQRVTAAAGALPEHDWPTLDAETVLRIACAGKRSVSALDVRGALTGMLEWPLPRVLEEAAPTHVEVPTGSRIKLDWSNDPPILAVRLQELFGLTKTPAVMNGRLPVLVHLLGPNYRPVQVTDDLASFWANTYPQVRKDLKARYPKHSWPEDPLTAVPMRGTKRQNARK
ncbi:MAG: ATP-dependent helicase HrpB [Planctomycetota bacterium]